MTEPIPDINNNFADLSLLKDCDENIKFAEQLIERFQISQSAKDELLSSIKWIKQRRLDSNLYLAVVGEFSSGKSTFINALLRDNLLKTSALPTTAAATHLYYGNAITVEVTLKAPKAGIIRTEPDSKQITVPWLPGVENLDNLEFIHVMTTQEGITENVTSLKITHPSSFLSNQIIIIDTPGINANEQHGYITQQVIEKEADAAIIIIPATIPLSQTLVNFLSTSLASFIHHCIFIVTRIDQIPDNERGKLLKNLRKRLGDKLGIESPLIYTCSAQVVMDLITRERSVPDKLLIWKDRFTDLEGIILKRLQHERSISISESLLRLLSLLFEELDLHLRSQWEHHEIKQITIQNEVIADLNSFISEQSVTCHRIVEDTALTVRLQVDKHLQKNKENTLTKLKTTIFNSENEAALKLTIQTGIQEIIEQQQKGLHQSLQGSFGKFAKAVKKANQFFDENFSAAYQKLQVLNSNVKVKSSFNKNDLKFNLNEILSDTQTLQQKLDNTDGNIALGGIASGATIGSFIFPVVGTIVGGVLGVIFSGFFMLSLEKRKENLWEQLHPNLDSYFEQVKSQVKQAIEVYTKEAESSIDKRIDDYAEFYQSAVDELLTEQATELQQLSNLQESIQTDLLELEKRQKMLVNAQQHLIRGTYSGAM